MKVGAKSIYPAQCRSCDAAKKSDPRAIRQQRRQRQAQFRQRINHAIPELYRDARLRHISPALREKMLSMVGERKGLFLHGPSGTGKSYSLCALARWFITQGRGVHRETWERLTFKLRCCFNSDETTEQSIIDPLVWCDILIIEDAGTSKCLDAAESDFNSRTLYSILDQRLEACRQTWITSNKSIPELETSFPERVTSRIHDVCESVRIEGLDRRRSSKPHKARGA